MPPSASRLQLTKRGDTIIVDFAGTDGQVAGPMNAPLSVTASGVYRRPQDDRRPGQPDPAQFRLLAAGDGDGASRAAW